MYQGSLNGGRMRRMRTGTDDGGPGGSDGPEATTGGTGGTGDEDRREDWRGRGRSRHELIRARRRGAAARGAPDEAHRDRAAALRRGGVRPRQVGRASRAPGALGGVCGGGRRGGHGRCAGRLVRGHRPVPASARAAHPAHGDHPDQEGPARRLPGRVRRRELPLRGRRTRSGCARSASAAASAPGWPSRSTPTGSTAELATALRGALTVLRDSDVQAVVGEAITRRADAQEIAPGIGKLLERIVVDGGHRRAVDLVCVRAHDWLVAARTSR